MRIDLQNVSLRFGDHEPLFEGVDLKIEGGDFVVIEGSSGVGKSSLLRLLNRLQEPTTGQVLVDNAPPRDADITDYGTRYGAGKPLLAPHFSRQSHTHAPRR